MAITSVFIVLAISSWAWMRAENARRDKLALSDEAYTTGEDNKDVLSGLRDLTDKQNGHHRYSG